MSAGYFRWVLLLLVAAFPIAACSSNSTEAVAASEIEAIDDRVLRIYNWDTYIDEQIITDFEREFGVTVDYQIYDSDNDMLEELRKGATDQYDIVVPSDFIVNIMRTENLLAPLNKENIPNFVNIDPTFINPGFDPGNNYCVPYQWGTVGIGYNITTTGREIESWWDFFDPAYAGRVAMLDDSRTTMGLVLILLGYSPNTTNPAQIKEAAEFLENQSNQIAAYVGDDGQDHLVVGNVDMVVEWSGDIFQLMEDNPNIRYAIPQEGSIIWTDNLCIPRDAQHKEIAEQFINFILQPEVGAALSNYVQYGSPNLAALPLINPEDLNNPAIYPPDDVRQRLFFLVDVNLAASDIYEQYWQEILSQHSR